MGPKANRPIQALLVMEDILDAISAEDRATLQSITAKVERSKSVVHDYLSTLEQLEYVVKKDSVYHLSFRWLHRGCNVRQQVTGYEAVRPELRRLADELDNEMVAFAGEEKDQVVAIEIIQSRDGIEYNTMPGMYYPMHCSAAGKAILAHYSSSRVDRIVDQYGLPAFTDRTITTKSELRDELEQIREAGVSYEYGEYHSGMATIAVPVLAPGDTPLGGVSIIGPEHHMSESDVKSELTNLLLSSVNIIELNYAGQED